MAVSEGAIMPAAVFNSLFSGSYQDQWLFYHQYSLKGLKQYRYSEFADKIQDLHLQQECPLLILAQYLLSVR